MLESIDDMENRVRVASFEVVGKEPGAAGALAIEILLARSAYPFDAPKASRMAKYTKSEPANHVPVFVEILQARNNGINTNRKNDMSRMRGCEATRKRGIEGRYVRPR